MNFTTGQSKNSVNTKIKKINYIPSNDFDSDSDDDMLDYKIKNVPIINDIDNPQEINAINNIDTNLNLYSNKSESDIIFLDNIIKNTNCPSPYLIKDLNKVNNKHKKDIYLSYNSSGIKGKFYINSNNITNTILDKKFSKIYTLCEFKQFIPFYKLYFDFDFKVEKNPALEIYNDKFYLFVNYIIDTIIVILKKIFYINDNDCKYIYALKYNNNINSKNKGAHLYFYNIIVNKEIHEYIVTNVFNNIQNCNIIPIEYHSKIFDKSILGNGMRLFYSKSANGDYYYPSLKLSTYVIPKNPFDNLIYSLIKSDNTDLSHKIKDTELNNYITFIDNLKINNNKKINIKNNNNKNIDNINDLLLNNFDINNFLNIGEKKELLIKLFDIINIKRLDDYSSWIKIVFLFKTYNLFNECVIISKKSEKFNNESLYKIRSIFSKPNNNNDNKKIITIGSLIKWASEDNFYECGLLMEKFKIQIKLELQNEKDIKNIIKRLEPVPNYTESSKYISEKAFENIIEVLEKVIDKPYNEYLFKKEDNNINENDDNDNDDEDDDDDIDNDEVNDDIDVDNYDSDIEDTIDTNQIIDNNILLKLNKNVNCILLESPTGSGKTTVFNKIINKLKPKSILSLVTRRTMISTHMNAFKDHNFTNYLDIVNKSNQKNFISSLEYSPFLKETTYDLLILDEMTSLINHFYSDTLNTKRNLVLKTLISLMQNAKYIICCDAYILDTVYCFLNNLCINYYYYKNTFKNKSSTELNIFYPENKTFGLDANLLKFSELMKDDIEDKKSILILTDSKKCSEKLYQCVSLLNKNKMDIMLINKDSGDLKDINVCNESFKNKIVITSPKIIYGLDILINYDNVYAVYVNTEEKNLMTVHEYMQQISRSRNAKCINILFLNTNNLYDKFISFDKHKELENKEYINYINNMKKLNNKYNLITDIFKKITHTGNFSIDTTNFFADIHYHKTYSDRLFYNNKAKIITLLCKIAGYNINYCVLLANIDNNNINLVKNANKNIKLIKDELIIDYLKEYGSLDELNKNIEINKLFDDWYSKEPLFYNLFNDFPPEHKFIYPNDKKKSIILEVNQKYSNNNNKIDDNKKDDKLEDNKKDDNKKDDNKKDDKLEDNKKDDNKKDDNKIGDNKIKNNNIDDKKKQKLDKLKQKEIKKLEKIKEKENKKKEKKLKKADEKKEKISQILKIEDDKKEELKQKIKLDMKTPLLEHINNISKITNMDITDLNIYTDENKFNTYLNKYYINRTKGELDKIRLSYANNNIPEIYRSSNLFDRINVLFWMENTLNIKRFDLYGIKLNDATDIANYKILFMTNIDKFLLLNKNIASDKKIKLIITNRINKIDSLNKLQKFVADCYNQIGEYIEVISKNKFIKNLKKHFAYYNFKIIL